MSDRYIVAKYNSFANVMDTLYSISIINKICLGENNMIENERYEVVKT